MVIDRSHEVRDAGDPLVTKAHPLHARPQAKKWLIRAVRIVLARYAQASAWLLLRARRPVVIGITGTVGKTTTVRMIEAILLQESVQARLGRSGATSSNMNDAWGLPLAVLGLKHYFWGSMWRQLPRWAVLPFRALRLMADPSYPRVLVLEHGAGNPGHLRRLTRLTRPKIGVITAIGEGHLERLGGLSGVMEEKSALATAPPRDGAVILGSGHAFVDELAGRAKGPVTIVDGEGLELNRNIARAVARELGVTSAEIESGLRNFSADGRRLQHLQIGGFHVIDDSHNANPLSMRLALQTLASSAAEGQRRVAVLGTMAELGENSDDLHAEAGVQARVCADLLVGVGPKARLYNPDLWFADVEACAGKLGTELRAGDIILFKASNGVQLWRAIEALPGGSGGPAT